MMEAQCLINTENFCYILDLEKVGRIFKLVGYDSKLLLLNAQKTVATNAYFAVENLNLVNILDLEKVGRIFNILRSL